MVAVATIWVTLSAATLFVGFDLFGERPISYLGTSSGPPWLFTVGLLVSALLLGAFHLFVRSRYPVGPGFSFVMLAGLAGQLVAALVPIGGEAATHRIHTTSALVLGASLPLLMWRFAAAQAPGRWRRLAYRIFFAEALACLVGLYLSGRGIAPLAEILPAAIFHFWIVVVTIAAIRPPARPELPELREPIGPATAALRADRVQPGGTTYTFGPRGSHFAQT